MQPSKPQQYSFYLLALLCLLTFTAIFAQEAGQTIIKREPIKQDYYAAGQSIHIANTAEGDVIIAGQRLTIDHRVAGDVIAAGETIQINGEVGDDIRAAGRLVQIGNKVNGHVVAAGETITISPQARIGNWLWAAGRLVEILGSVGDNVKAMAETVVIGGEIRGNVEVFAEHVRVQSSTVIHGYLRIKSPNEPVIAPGAKILGGIQKAPMPEIEPAPVVKAIIAVGIFFILSLALTGIVYYLLFPNFSVRTSRQIGQVPLASLGLGFAVLVVTPVLTSLLFFTGIGFLLGILLIAFYLLIVFTGGITGVIYVSDAALRKWFKKAAATKGLMILSMIISYLVLVLVQLIPLVGSLAVMILIIMGVGALNQQLWKQYRA